jgi:Asp-tRNA(Asn)/Glu-tRNA(Gln) amidotransferase A subunit family amidase
MSLSMDQARSRIAACAELNAFIALSAEEGASPIVAVKDMIDVAGMSTTRGTRLAMAPAQQDAEVVARIREAGGAIIGKTNLQPWAFGVASTNPWWGDVGHPRDPAHVPGGSSGGSAVAVAAGMCDWALGTDTGGSVRVPAALCGTVGFKPSHDAISVTGVVPLAASLDCVGIFAPDVATATAAFGICTGQALPPPSPSIDRPLRLAVPEGWVDALEPPVAAVWAKLSPGFGRVRLPERAALARWAMVILLAEAAMFHRETLAVHPEAYSADVRAALQRGLATTPADYEEACQARREAIQAVALAMSSHDALVLPTVGRTAPSRAVALRDKDFTRYTLPFNLTGQPAISIPVPVDGWPVGLQLVGRAGQDMALLEAAGRLERALQDRMARRTSWRSA